MKKMMALWMTMALLLGMTAAAGAREEAPLPRGGRTAQEVYEELIVGSTTAMTGNFFSDMWPTSAADLDVQSLIHGYSLTQWSSRDSAYVINQTVVNGMVSREDAAGNKTYTIALSESLVYSDGSPITAQDYVFAILLSAAPQIAELGGINIKTNYILGAEAFAAGRTETLAGVRLLGEHLFSICVSAEYLPNFYELGVLGFTPYPIARIAPGCVAADDGRGAFIRNRQEGGEPLFTAQLLRETLLDDEKGYLAHPDIISGPYVLTAYDPAAATATFALNERYLGDVDGNRPAIERLKFTRVWPAAMMDQLLSGEIDLLVRCTHTDAIHRGIDQSRDAIALKNYMRRGLSMISFNCEQGPLRFTAVRQAAALCLDRDAFIEQYVQEYGVKVNGYYGIGQWMASLIHSALDPDLEEAQEGEEGGINTRTPAWQALAQRLENLEDYAYDPGQAQALLEADGWTLNPEGSSFDPARDTVRAKWSGDELLLLELQLTVPEGNLAESLFDDWQRTLAAIGVRLEITTLPFEEMLAQYNRQQPRDNDMFFVASNFMNVFDPTYTFSTSDAAQGALNTTGLRDARLEELALELRGTAPGDILAYCDKWMDFQQYFGEALPILPLYSNVYFDFHTVRLRNYNIGLHSSWAEAIMDAYLSDAPVNDENDELILIGSDG